MLQMPPVHAGAHYGRVILEVQKKEEVATTGRGLL